MKKIIALFLIALIMLVMCSCNSDGSADIWIFAESFNKKNDAYQIQLSQITVLVSEDEKKEYECFIKVDGEKKVLLTLNSIKDGTIVKLSLTAAEDDKITSEAFCSISETAAMVLMQETNEDISYVIEKLGLSLSKKQRENETTYYETNICRYSLISNSQGTAFIAELSKYLDSSTELLSLRNPSEIIIEHTNEYTSEYTNKNESLSE